MSIESVCKSIEARISQLKQNLGGLNILGERALRYWVLREVFEDLLHWPTANIVAGEKFDALLIDSRNIPIIYLETKSIGRGSLLTEFADANKRFQTTPSLEFMIFTDLKNWKSLSKSNQTKIWNPSASDNFFDSLKYEKYSG